MWHVLKTELNYHRFLLGVATIFIFWNSIENFLIKESIYNSKLGNKSYLYIVPGIFIFAIFQKRFSEKRERLFAILPIPNRKLALSRFWFAVIPFAIMMIYFVITHLIVKSFWHIELSVPLIHIGIMLIIVAGFIRSRDDWFSQWNFGGRIQSAFVAVLIIQVLTVAILLNVPESYKKTIPIIGEYAEIIFFLLGLVIMLTTITSFIKRKSYLN